MGKIITIGMQKGGVGKTTTSAALGYLLSCIYPHVLMVDADSQGNLSEMLFQQPISWWRTEQHISLWDAIQSGQIKPHIVSINDNMDMVPGSDLLGLFDRYVYEHKEDSMYILKKLLEPVRKYYDFIIIDTAPALSNMLLNCLTASDYLLPVFETSQFSYAALAALLDSEESVMRNSNPDLRVIGILPTLMDSRRVDNKDYVDMAREKYGELVFENIIKRTASTGRLAYLGINSNPEIKRATAQFLPVVQEIIDRIDRRKADANS